MLKDEANEPDGAYSTAFWLATFDFYYYCFKSIINLIIIFMIL